MLYAEDHAVENLNAFQYMVDFTLKNMSKEQQDESRQQEFVKKILMAAWKLSKNKMKIREVAWEVPGGFKYVIFIKNQFSEWLKTIDDEAFFDSPDVYKILKNRIDDAIQAGSINDYLKYL